MSTVAFFTFSGVVRAAELPPNCKRAETLLAAGDASAAESEYRKLLGTERCGEPGFAKAHAKAAKAAKEAAGAQAPQAQIALAERLQDAGFEKQARDIVKAVVEKSHGKITIPSRLRAPDQPTAWWRAAIAEVAPALLSVAEVIAVLLGAVAAVFALLSVLRALARRYSPVVRLTGFGGSSDATLGAALSSTLSATLLSMSDRDASSRIYGIGATEPQFNLPKAVTDAVPQAGLIAGLLQVLDQLLPRRLNLLSGTVHGAQAGRGAGLTLAIADRSGKLLEQETFWEQEYLIGPGTPAESQVARYERLVRPAAVWLAFRKTIGYKETDRPLGTGDWRSYARFAVGEVTPDPALKRQLFELALDRDPENLGARLNLATALMQRPAGYVEPAAQSPPPPWEERAFPDRWEERREEARVHLEWVTRATCRDTSNPLWFRSRMLQVVYYISKKEGKKAVACVDTLGRGIREHWESAPLSELLRALDPAAKVLKLTASLLAYKRVPKAAATIDARWLTALAQYNLACFWSRVIEHAPDYDKGKALEHSVDALRQAIAREARMVSAARTDPAFDRIRDTTAFEQLLASATAVDRVPAAADPQTRYTITLDPGSELTELIKTYA